MAFYDNTLQKRKKVNYADQGAWEEEGSRYRENTRKYGRGTDDSERTDDRSSRNGRRKGGGTLRRDGNQENFSHRTQGKSEYSRGHYADPTEKRNSRGAGFSGGTRGETDQRKRGRNSQSQGPERMKTGWNDRKPRETFRPEARGEDRSYRQYEHVAHSAPERHEEEQENILCGRNPIREALRSGRDIEKLLVQKGELSGSAKEIVQEARSKKIMVQEVDKRRLDEIALHHQGLIAFASAYQYATVEDILKAAEDRQEAPFIVILDSVTDPHNLGAVIRTAECAGAHGVIIPQHRSVGLTPAAVKASAGAIEHIAVARVTNLNRMIEELKKNGVWVYAVTMEGKDYEKVEFQGATALVIGAEGEGISRLTEEKCDLSVSLPMRGSLDSLNASVAAGIVMYRVLSCRRKSRG